MQELTFTEVPLPIPTHCSYLLTVMSFGRLVSYLISIISPPWDLIHIDCAEGSSSSISTLFGTGTKGLSTLEAAGDLAGLADIFLTSGGAVGFETTFLTSFS